MTNLNPNHRRNGDAIDVTLTGPAEPLWMPLSTGAGRTHVTVIAGPAESGKSTLLEHIEFEAFTAGFSVTRLRPLDPTADLAAQLSGANALIDARQGGATREPALFTVDDTGHLVDDYERSRALQRVAKLGPALGIGLLFTAETVAGRYRAQPMPVHDQAVLLGRGSRDTGFGEFHAFPSRLTNRTGHYLDSTGGYPIGFDPIRITEAA